MSILDNDNEDCCALSVPLFDRSMALSTDWGALPN